MRVELAYGKHGLTIEAPDHATVLLPRERAGVDDEGASLHAALRNPLATRPLREMVSPSDRVVVVFSDITRPMPNARVLPWLLAELADLPKQNIILLNGLGTHRPNTTEELERMLGPSIVHDYVILQHDAWDEANLVELGTTRYGHPIVVNRAYLEASFKILTGFIEPHFFAGFSGGPKAVLPAIAGFQAIMDNHGYMMLNDPAATWGRTEGNPVWEEIREVGEVTRPDFLLNVTLNRHRHITGIFAGDVWKAHALGVEQAREAAMVPVQEPYDIVVTTNSGYPLDINLYQAVKGMSCAAQIVKPGGTIIIAAECADGVPDYGEYRRLVREAGSLQGIDDMISQRDFRCQDQWEAQLQARVQHKADVLVYSSYLSDQVLREMLLRPCHDIEAALASLMLKYGPTARVCILPEGPQTIPYLA